MYQIITHLHIKLIHKSFVKNKKIQKLKRDTKNRIIYKPTKGKPSRFPKGVSGNLKGRPKGSTSRFSIYDLKRAIKSVEHDKKQAFLISWLESAWDDAGDMSKIIEFMMPKLRSIEGFVSTFDGDMTDKIAASIQKRLKERFE